jgi:class 3 adenylate cyclase
MAQSLRVARLNLYRPIPSDPSVWFDADEIAQARAYNRPLQVFSFVYGFVGFATLSILVVSRAVPRLIRATGASSWPLQLLVALVVLVVAITVVTLPLDAWKARYQRRWQMAVSSRTSPVNRIAALIGETLLFLLLLAVILFPVWFLIRSTAYWWILAALVVYATFLTVFLLLPAVFVPFFGKITKIDDDDLRRRVRRVAREAGVDVSDVYQSDESKRTPTQGGYIAGLGRSRRVVLYDNLLSRPGAEIDVFIARKISGMRRRHGLVKAASFLAIIAGQFAVIRLAVAWKPLLRIGGFSNVREPAAAPLLVLLFMLTFLGVELAAAWIGRAQSRINNLGALEFTRDADAYMALIRGLHARNREELAPSWWRRVRSQDPTPAELLTLGEWWRARRRVTVLFTDIEDSTAMLERLGDEGWYEVRRDHNELIRERVAAHDGTEVDSAGDGFLIVFQDAGEALLCAIESQQALDAYNAGHPDVRLSVRMGLHAGDVIRKGREVIGREVHVAARVASCARGGEILASAAVREAVQATDRFSFEDERDVELKGFNGTYALWRVPWAGAREPAIRN